MKKKQLMALLLATVMLIGMLVPVHAETSEITVESVLKEAFAVRQMRQDEFMFLLLRNANEIIAEVKRRRGVA